MSYQKMCSEIEYAHHKDRISIAVWVEPTKIFVAACMVNQDSKDNFCRKTANRILRNRIIKRFYHNDVHFSQVLPIINSEFQSLQKLSKSCNPSYGLMSLLRKHFHEFDFESYRKASTQQYKESDAVWITFLSMVSEALKSLM